MKTSMLALVGLMVGLTLSPLTRGATPLPLFERLGNYTRKVTAMPPDAHRYFNQELALLHGFNHGSAIRSFQESARLDPTCAMVHWGIALACDPHINLPVVPPPAAELARPSSPSQKNTLSALLRWSVL